MHLELRVWRGKGKNPTFLNGKPCKAAPLPGWEARPQLGGGKRALTCQNICSAAPVRCTDGTDSRAKSSGAPKPVAGQVCNLCCASVWAAAAVEQKCSTSVVVEEEGRKPSSLLAAWETDGSSWFASIAVLRSLVERTVSKCLVLLLEVLAFEDVGVFRDGAGEAACCWGWS